MAPDDWRLSVRPLLTSIPTTRDILVNYKTPILINVFSIAIGNIAELKMKRERGAKRQIISTFGKTFPQNTVVCLFTMILATPPITLASDLGNVHSWSSRGLRVYFNTCIQKKLVS